MRRFASLFLCLLILAPVSEAAAQWGRSSGKKTKAHPGLVDPRKAKKKAPDTFKVAFETTKGKFVIEADRSWSPNGVDRLYNLVKIGFFTDVAFYRVVDGFMAQFGIHGDPEVSSVWGKATIKDDPVKQSNKPGYLTFAKTGTPNSRSTQFFISYGDNAYLDEMGFAPIGKVVEGMDVVEKLHNGYGEIPQMRGKGPDPGTIGREGNKYLKEKFPELDYIKSAKVVK